MKNSVIFEDEHLVCIAQPGHRQDRVVITFSEMLMRPARQNAIWAGTPIRKLGYPALGFVAKRQNWFPQKSVDKALRSVDLEQHQGAKRIGYGFSMGGWAALFYARQMRLDAVVSFSPQYSIDPNEVSDKRFTKFYQQALHGDMSITSDSAAAINLIVCDPHDRGDYESAKLICEKIDARLVTLPYVGHGSVRCITNTQTLGQLLDSVVTDDLQSAVRLLRSCRHRAPSRAMNIAYHATKSRPRTALNIFRAYPEQFPIKKRAQFLHRLKNTSVRRDSFQELCALSEDLDGHHPYLAILADYLRAMGRKTEARALIARAIDLHDSPGYRFIAARMKD